MGQLDRQIENTVQPGDVEHAAAQPDTVDTPPTTPMSPPQRVVLNSVQVETMEADNDGEGNEDDNGDSDGDGDGGNE